MSLIALLAVTLLAGSAECTGSDEKLITPTITPNPFAEMTVDKDCVLTPAEAGEMELLWKGRHLPASARNVRIHVLHFQDTVLYIRFDAPLADARAFAAGLIVGRLQRAQPDYWPQATLSWWPRSLPAGALTGEDSYAHDDGRPAVRIMLQPHGDRATVWMMTFDD